MLMRGSVFSFLDFVVVILSISVSFSLFRRYCLHLLVCLLLYLRGLCHSFALFGLVLTRRRAESHVLAWLLSSRVHHHTYANGCVCVERERVSFRIDAYSHCLLLCFRAVLSLVTEQIDQSCDVTKPSFGPIHTTML